MRVDYTTAVDAPVETVWSRLIDVTDWPRWTASVTEVRLLQPGELRVGARARVSQPRLPTLVWTVDALEPLRRFRWSTGSLGVRTVGDHRLEPRPGGGSTLALSIDQTGPLGELVGRVTARMTRTYLRMEGDGMRRASEETAAGR